MQKPHEKAEIVNLFTLLGSEEEACKAEGMRMLGVMRPKVIAEQGIHEKVFTKVIENMEGSLDENAMWALRHILWSTAEDRDLTITVQQIDRILKLSSRDLIVPGVEILVRMMEFAPLGFSVPALHSVLQVGAFHDDIEVKLLTHTLSTIVEVRSSGHLTELFTTRYNVKLLQTLQDCVASREHRVRGSQVILDLVQILQLHGVLVPLGLLPMMMPLLQAFADLPPDSMLADRFAQIVASTAENPRLRRLLSPHMPEIMKASACLPIRENDVLFRESTNFMLYNMFSEG
eukprot:TRINITY_DN9494_c0_g1_i2.p1 TRINITY_DN9494_c0_g1~~TRINITY_DN9494_c0_g1_i2.p1  ORF type:complete len:289 (+),score=56.89 TRINITY_DN9494_c0_g1_i2:37-903(+)